MDVNNNLDAALNEVEGTGVYGGNAEDEAYDILVKNGSSNSKVSLLVYSANTLKQVAERTAEDLGLNKDKKHNIFINEATGKATTDMDMSLEEFKIEPNVVLSIYQDGNVAAQ